MTAETLHRSRELVIRRQVLGPGEATPWHTDPCRRFTVVVHGGNLRIDYQDGDSTPVSVATGAAAWDDPQPRVHRAVNTGRTRYEEVVTFYLPARREDSGTDPQPEAPP